MGVLGEIGLGVATYLLCSELAIQVMAIADQLCLFTCVSKVSRLELVGYPLGTLEN